MKIIKEFARYVLVGGVAFIVDLVTLIALQEMVFKAFAWGVYVSAVFAFCAGLAANYWLSVNFVFASARAGKGRSFGAFVLFVAICIIGLLLTEGGMWCGVEVLKWNYVFVKIVVSGFVLIWNYAAKKLLIF